MKNLSLLLVSFLLFQLIIYPQAPDTVWTRAFGGTLPDGGSSVIQTTDGSFVVTGYTSSFGAGGNDVGLMKVDPNGNLVWLKTFGGALNDAGSSVIQTTDGNYVITGITNGNDVLLMKVDPNGNLIWFKTFDGDRGNCVIQTADGGLLIAGSIWIDGPPAQFDVLLIKTNWNGNQIWSKSFGSNTSNEYGKSVIEAVNGNFFITGNIQLTSTDSDVLLIRADPLGVEILRTHYGGTAYDIGNSLIQASDGNLVITGGTDSFGAGLDDVGLMKINTDGGLIWLKTFGGTGIDYGTSVIQSSDGNYVITGYTNSFSALADDVALMKVDSNGNLLWIKILGGIDNDQGMEIKQISGGGYIITGTTESFGAGESDVYLIKFHPDITDVEDEFVVSNFFLNQNYPNPFNPVSNIQYAIGSRQFVSLKVYDVLGNEVSTLVNEEKPAGEYEVEFTVGQDSSPDIASGIYFYQLKAGNFIETKKMILMK